MNQIRIGNWLMVLVSAALIGCATAPSRQVDLAMNRPVDKRPFSAVMDGRWIGNGISYSPYRDGESPDLGSVTDPTLVLEDLRLVAQRWQLIRMYSADEQSRHVLELIRRHGLPIRVMQGAWVSGHQSDEENEAQVESVIELARQYPEIVVAVNIGNEIFVDWSAHRLDDMERVIDYIRQTRAAIAQPVTVNDDYNFWNKPHAAVIAAEVDFIGLHAYAFWNNVDIHEALDWTVKTYRDVAERYPDHLVAYTETGWPTSRVYDDSYEGSLIGTAGEEEQRQFLQAYNRWVDRHRIVSFYFEAFDEKWKGGFDGEDPERKAEKHWGLYRSDRTPKAALK